MTRSRSAALLGAQVPRVRSVPRYRYTDGEAAIELAEAAGLYLDEWEAQVLRDAMAVRTDDPDRWASLEVGLVCPRQNGKGAILEARELAGLFLLGERLILHSAHEFKTAREAFLRVSGLVENTPELKVHVKTIRTSHGEEGIILKDGRRLQFVARSTSSGRGFTGDTIILDEAYALTDDMMQALLPTISARSVTGNPQVWYTSSAGDMRSYTLGRLRARGEEGADPRLCYLEWSAEDTADLDDPRAWAEANPGLGIRISEEAILAERRILSDSGFARERLGIWPTEDTDRDIPAETWEAVCFPDVEARMDKARFGVEMSPEQTSAAIAAWNGDVGELVEHRAGSPAWLVPRIEELVTKHKGVVVLDGNGPAGFLEPVLTARRIKVEKLANADVYSACSRMYEAIADRKVAVRAAYELDEAVAVARKKTVSGDRFVWRRDQGDVTPFFALTLAFGPAQPPRAEPFVFRR